MAYTDGCVTRPATSTSKRAAPMKPSKTTFMQSRRSLSLALKDLLRSATTHTNDTLSWDRKLGKWCGEGSLEVVQRKVCSQINPGSEGFGCGNRRVLPADPDSSCADCHRGTLSNIPSTSAEDSYQGFSYCRFSAPRLTRAVSLGECRDTNPDLA